MYMYIYMSVPTYHLINLFRRGTCDVGKPIGASSRGRGRESVLSHEPHHPQGVEHVGRERGGAFEGEGGVWGPLGVFEGEGLVE